MKQLTLVLLLNLLCINAQITKKVLFLGNSYTYTYNVPNTIKLLANAANDNLEFDINAPGAYTLLKHAANTTTLTKIDSKNWDHVVLQEQSVTPFYFPNQFFTGTTQLISKINTTSTCKNKIILFMTWGRKNNPTLSYNEMQKLLTNNYNEVAAKSEAEVAPVGIAWKKVRDDNDPVNLYSGDGSHQSFAGTYLAACVFYATIFDKTPVGLTYTGSLSAENAKYLQEKAYEAYQEYINKNLIHTTEEAATYKELIIANFSENDNQLNQKVTDCCLKTFLDIDYTGGKNKQVSAAYSYLIFQSGFLIKEVSNVPVNFTSSDNSCTKNVRVDINFDLNNVKEGSFDILFSFNNNRIRYFTLEKRNSLNIDDFNKNKVSITTINNKLKISFNAPYSYANLKVHSILGKTVLQKTQNNIKNMELDIDALSNGIYFLTSVIDGNRITKKFIKK